ncbi:MAG: hypothetical protein ACREJ3_15840, partial [Polyangiaceae bacterium]
MTAGKAAENRDAGGPPAGDAGDGRGRAGPRWRILAIGALIGLGMSLLANVLLVRAAWRYYGRASAIRLDPLGLDVYAKERTAPPPRDQPLLVLFGDSRAAMWGDLPSLRGYRVLNRGIGFQTTAQIL